MNIEIRDVLQRIKWAYQRVRYGYDETIKWGFDGYFDKFVRPLAEFCQAELEWEEQEKLNPERIKVFQQTLRLIDDYQYAQAVETWDVDEEERTTIALWKYFAEHIGWYWN